MIRTIELALNKFAGIPARLTNPLAAGSPKSEIDVDLAKLYHHYYLNRYGIHPPDPNPVHFEYLHFFVSSKEFRLIGDGIGITKQAKLHSSNQLGEAFCRYFLHEYLDVPYFAHIEDAIAGTLDATKFGLLRVERTKRGDLPDYLCADVSRRVRLAEAKGRSSSISFSSTEFATWRNQFGRVRICDAHENAFAAKGYVVATRLAAQTHGSKVRSKLFAEDPRSPGSESLEGSNGEPLLASKVIALHYAGVAEKLAQPILSAALSNGSLLPEEIQLAAAVWEFQDGPLKGRRFVGGHFPREDATLVRVRDGEDQFVVRGSPPWVLGSHGPAFFGLEESIFRNVVKFARGAERATRGIEPLPAIPFFYSAVSVLRDGTLLSPVEFLKLVALSAPF
jgi:hypothetical protein